MPVLTDLASAEVKRSTTRLYGKTLTRPSLLMSDGINVIWAVDVEITETDVTGRINQFFQQKKDGTLETQGKGDKKTFKSNLVTGIPGQEPADWQLDDSLPGHVDTTLHNVPLSNNNQQLFYADVGSPVIIDRSESGTWQVTGFSIEYPGTHKLYPVDLGNMTIGTIMDLSITTELLTLAELGTLRPFGELPLGASAIYEGDQLLRLV